MKISYDLLIYISCNFTHSHCINNFECLYFHHYNLLLVEVGNMACLMIFSFDRFVLLLCRYRTLCLITSYTYNCSFLVIQENNGMQRVFQIIL